MYICVLFKCMLLYSYCFGSASQIDDTFLQYFQLHRPQFAVYWLCFDRVVCLVKVDERDMRWFYTGDIGQFHEDGCIEIIDRKKDIVKLQAGEYVSLGKVEAVLAGSSYVDNVMLHADPFHSNTVALVVANQSALEAWAKKAGVDYSDFAELCSKPETCKEVLSSLNQSAKQGKLERFEIPTKVKLIAEPWTPESGLVTAAMKLKREAVRKAFAGDLKALYS